MTTSSSRVALLALSLALFAMACGSSNQTRKVEKPVAGFGHMEYVAADAAMVLSVDNLAGRVAAITSSKAYAHFKRSLELAAGGDSEIGQMTGKSDEALALLERVLGGRITMALYDPPGTDATSKGEPPTRHEIDESDFVLIADADVREAIAEAMKLDGGDPPRWVDSGDGIFEMTDPDGTPNGTFVAQSGPIGLVSSERNLLTRTIGLSRGSSERLLADTAPFQRLTGELRKDADLFVYLADWRIGDDSDWDDMLGASKELSAPRGIGGTVSLEHGIDIEILIEFDERELNDPDLQLLLPALRGRDTSLKLPATMPLETLAYVGFALRMDKLGEWISQQTNGMGLPPEQSNELLSIVQDFLSAFDGEFGLALTGISGDAPLSHNLGMPAPGVALIGQLTGKRSEGDIARTLEGLFNMVNQGAGPDGAFGPPVTEKVEDVVVQIYPIVSDPGLEMAYAVDGEIFVMGTRDGVLDVITSRKKKGASSLAQSTSPLVARSLKEPSNYMGYVNLKAIYGLVKQHYGPMLAMMTGGLAGAAEDDNLETLFEVFEYAGASMVYREGASTLRFYITARDLP